MGASALDEAVSNVNEKVSQGVAYRYRDGVKRTFPFVSNEEASLALVDDELTDDGTLNLLTNDGTGDSNVIWYAVAAGVIVIGLRRRERKLMEELQMAHVEDNADTELEVETTQIEEPATILVSEDV